MLKLQDIDPGVNRNSALRCSIKRGFLDITKLLLGDLRVDPSARNNSAIRRKSSLLAFPFLFFSAFVSPFFNLTFSTNFLVAVRRGYIQLIELLLADPRVNPADRNNAPIRDAAKRNLLDIAKLLLKGLFQFSDFFFRNFFFIFLIFFAFWISFFSLFFFNPNDFVVFSSLARLLEILFLLFEFFLNVLLFLPLLIVIFLLIFFSRSPSFSPF